MLAVDIAGVTGVMLLQHALLRQLIALWPQARDLDVKERQQMANRLMLIVAPPSMVALSIVFLCSEGFNDPEARWANVASGPASAGEWAGRVFVAFNLYELVFYAVYGKEMAFWLHHVITLVISLNWLVLRTATFWGSAVILMEATTPCLVATRMMKEAGWTCEPLYKLAVSGFWVCWIAVRICFVLVLLVVYIGDLYRGLPSHVPLYFAVINGISVLGLFVLSCIWLVPLTRIFVKVVTGKDRAA